MFIFTAKLTRKKIAVMLGGAGILLIALIVFISTRGGASASSVSAPSAKGVKTAEDRVAFLEAYGWKADASAEESQEVMIPKEFDDVFTQYNELQISQGFNLEKLAGKRVMRYVYPITNHPSGQSVVYASLLVYKNNIIGGDVQCPALDGFMHGFEMPAGSGETYEENLG